MGPTRLTGRATPCSSGCVLIGLTTAINAGGVRLLARINNVGVFTELVGVILLIVLLFARARHGPRKSCLVRHNSHSSTAAGWLLPLLAAAVMPSYVMYGFDTAGTLARGTKDPRRQAPLGHSWALGAAGVAGGLLIVAGLLAAADPAGESLGEITGGLPAIVKEVLGQGPGTMFLITVIFAISVCALAVHAGTVRLMFSIAQEQPAVCPGTGAGSGGDGHADRSGRGHRSRGGLDSPGQCEPARIIETLCSVAIVWANLAYLMVSARLLWTRLRGWPCDPAADVPDTPRTGEGRRFALGRWGLAVNIVAVCWGIFVIVNMSWPRVEIYGTDPLGRYAAASPRRSCWGWEQSATWPCGGEGWAFWPSTLRASRGSIQGRSFPAWPVPAE